MHRRFVLLPLLALALMAPVSAMAAANATAAASAAIPPTAELSARDRPTRKPAVTSARSPAATPVRRSAKAQRKARRGQPRSYGFLPGVRTPEQIEHQRRADARRGWIVFDGWGNVYRYGIPGAGFHRGRWSGGTLGPCWTQTPIGPLWNCGK